MPPKVSPRLPCAVVAGCGAGAFGTSCANKDCAGNSALLKARQIKRRRMLFKYFGDRNTLMRNSNYLRKNEVETAATRIRHHNMLCSGLTEDTIRRADWFHHRQASATP